MYNIIKDKILNKKGRVAMKVDLQEIDELLHNSNLSEVARAVGIPYRTLQAWKLGENKWWADTQDKLTKLQNYVNDETYWDDEENVKEAVENAEIEIGE